jgi:hypothetical protein
MRLVAETGREIKVALKRCDTCVKAVAFGCSPLWFPSSDFMTLLIGLKCCSHDRLRVKEPTTLEAKRGNILYCMKD